MDVQTASVNMNFMSSGPQWEMAQTIGKDETTGLKYSAEDLIGKTAIYPYNEDGQEVYFKGQYDENLKWNGNCIINVYKDNNLIIITDANYENGELVNYKQIFPDVNKDKNIWVVSDRVVLGEINIGETWNYQRVENRIKTFDFNSVTEDDMLSYDDFKKIYNDLGLVSYYCGNTSDGKYNDDTGNAYSILFYDDGTVRTLYKGKFKNGDYNDNSEDSWYITSKIENGSMYQYYKGKFVGGHPVGIKKDKSAVFENPVTEEYIDKIIRNYDFKYELKWSDELIGKTNDQ